MIHVEPAAEPAEFDQNVRVPGLRAVAEMVGKAPSPARKKGQGKAFEQRTKSIKQADGSTTKQLITCEEDLPSSKLHPYWRDCLDDLKAVYKHVCAYSCFRMHPITGGATVDHFVPCSKAWDKAYEWSNYRLACSRLNGPKAAHPDVLDPFKVQTGWFQLELVGFPLIPAPGLDPAVTRRIRATIDRLKLNDAGFRDARAEDAEYYWSGEVSLELLRKESPLVAFELDRRGRLNASDISASP